MIVSPDPQASRPSMMMIEGGLTLIACAIAFVLPGLGDRFFSRVERASARLARRKGLTVVVVGLAALLLRLAILPVCPIPHPFCSDDFSNLLAADTFASGRLTNPTPAMWTHFEGIHIDMKPTYMSMYFPGNGLVLAGGRLVAGHPWFGILFVTALMCGAITWMLQAWLPPGWALLGGVIAILRIGLFSYWINTYTGGGSISALGGALVLGALPRLKKRSRFRYALLMAIGIVLLGFTRPYEGLLLCLPVAIALGYWLWKSSNRPTAAALARIAALPLMVVIAAATWMGYYDYRAFGSPWTLPYTVNRNTYAMAPYFVWQSPRPEPAYRHPIMQRFYHEVELNAFKSIHRRPFYQTFLKALGEILFFVGFALAPAFVMIPRVLFDRRVRFLVICAAMMVGGVAIEIFVMPHYLAPFLAVFYALGLQAMRHVRAAGLAGRTIVRLVVIICVGLAFVKLFAGPLHVSVPTPAASEWVIHWYGPSDFGLRRSGVQSKLEQLPGTQLAIVRYSPRHFILDEWVSNASDIDKSKVIWAREMDSASDLDLIRFYRDRHVWLIEPDKQPPEISAYRLTGEAGSAMVVVPSSNDNRRAGPEVLVTRAR